MGTNCAVITDKEVATLNKTISKQLIKKLEDLNIKTTGLTKEECITVISKIMTEKGYTQDTVMEIVTKQNTRLLNDAVASFRIQKMKEAESLKNNKIGNAVFTVLNSKEVFQKKDPQNNKNTLYIFADNLQASNEVFGETIGDTIEVKGGTKLHVGGSSAVVRTNTNGNINNNAVGLVTKKNAQNEKGVFINEEGYFQDTDEDLKIFEEANRRAIKKIKELLLVENSPYTKISMIHSLATEKAALPERFAVKLADMLWEELEISTQLTPNGKGFGLTNISKGASAKQNKKKKQKEETEKDKAIKKTKSKIEELIKSLKRKRPILDSVNINAEDFTILQREIPNIERRLARISLISDDFSAYLTRYINTAREYYANITDRTEDEEFYYEGLTKGTEAQQRVFALGHFYPQEGVSLCQYIFNKIQEDLQLVVDMASTEEGIENLANQLLAGEGIMGENFLDELWAKDYDPHSEKAKRFAFARARYLKEAYEAMLQKDVFKALCKEAAINLEFTENIRMSFKDVPVQTEEDTNDENMSEESKENANKEGYMIKYKLTDPAKSLTVRIKTLLGSIYKRDHSDPTLYAFDDLGNKVKMDALTAYRILIEEFSEMRSAEEFIPTLDNAISKYPWLNDLRDRLVFNADNAKAFDQDLRNEFYTTMRKVQVPYGMITESGLLKYLNKSISVTDFLDNVIHNYEGRIILSEGSIYTETGDVNIDNCLAINKLYLNPFMPAFVGNTTEIRNKKKHASYKYQPFGWALENLKAFYTKNNRASVADTVEALLILAGMSKNHSDVNLEEVLRSLGIDTSKINIDSLFGEIPYLDENTISWLKDKELDHNEKANFEDLEAFITSKQINNLIKILSSIRTIVDQSGNKLQKGDHIISKYQGAYTVIGGALAAISEGYTSLTFRHAGSMRASYTVPDFISDLVGIVKNVENIEQANEWLEKNYGHFDFFKDPMTKQWCNTWLEKFFDPGDNGDYPFRQGFEYINMLSFMGSSKENNVSNVSKDTLREGLIHAFYAANNDAYNNTFGYYRVPLLSDVDAVVLMKGIRYTGEGYQNKIVEGLVKVVMQEVNRIKHVQNTKSKPDTVKIEYYNDEKSNGEKFQYFPEFNNEETFKEIMDICKMQPGETAMQFTKRRNAELAEKISNLLQEKVQRFLDSMSDNSKEKIYNRITKNQQKKENSNNDTSETVDITEANKKESKEEKERKLKEINEYLTEFFYNDFFAQSQIQQLIGGDLALYKNFTDYIKRNKQAYACGERLFAKETDDQGNIIKDMVETVIYLEDDTVMSNSYEQLKDLLMSSDMSETDKGIIRYTLEAYKKITSTDGQSLRTMDSFRKIFKAKGGVWTDDMERAYQNIKNSKTITAKDFTSLWNPIKPFFFGYESIKNGDRTDKIVTQHKNSEYMITALYSFLSTALNRSPKLLGLHKFMEKYDIDVVHFHSVVKEGYNSSFNLNYDSLKYERFLKEKQIKVLGKLHTGSYEQYIKKLVNALDEGLITQKEFTEAKNQFDFKSSDDVVEALEKQSRTETGEIKEVMFKHFPMDAFMTVQPSGDHLIDAEAILGTQIKNIIMADLPSNFNITITLNGKEHNMNREEAVRFYNALLVDNLLDAFVEIDNEFSNIKSLQNALFSKMEGNPKYGADVKAALQLNKEGTAFVLPFNSPTLSNKIEDLILSTFKNAIQRQKIKGGNAVLVSNFGLHDNLSIVYNNNDKSQGVKYIECYLPATNKVMYEDFLEKDGEFFTINFEKMEKALGKAEASELLDIIGYRIPTEDKYSIMPIRIKGFLPITAGSTIMLPADIITMSGTDFDIDKLFLMMKEFDRITYPKSIKSEFKNWLIKNKESIQEADDILKAIFESTTEENTEINNEYKKFKRLLNTRKDGYTDKDIDILASTNEIFEIFLNDIGDSMAYDVPMYKILRPKIESNGESFSLDEISKQSSETRSRRRAIRNNMIIDVMRQTLANKEVSKMLMQPGNFDRVRHSSREQRIMHEPVALAKFVQQWKEYNKDRKNKGLKEQGLYDYMNSMSTKELDKFFEENASTISPLDINTYIDMQKNLMEGNALVGIFAVNSSNHYKLQFIDLPLDSDYQLTINGTTFTHVDLQFSPMTGERISKINAEFQAASPDNGKDPCLGDMGINPKTAARVELLSRLGLTPEIIGILNTCDDFVKMAEVIANKAKRPKVNSIKEFNLDINKLTEFIALYRTDPEAFQAALQAPDTLHFIVMFNTFMYKVNELAEILNSVSKVSRVDSPNGALAVTIPEVIQQYYAAVNFMRKASSPKCPIKNLDKLVNINLDAKNIEDIEDLRSAIMNSPVPRLQAAYTLGIKSAISMCKDLFPGLSNPVLEGFNILRNQTQKALTTKSSTTLVRKFIAEFTMAMLSQYSSFATDEHTSIMDKRNYYIHDFPMKYKAFLEEKDQDGYLKYPEIVNLNIIQRIDNLDEKGLKFKNIGKISDKARKHFVEELESLLASDKPEVVQFAIDLFMYNYYDNGFQFGHNNFGIFFTTLYMKNMPKFLESLNKGNANLMNNNFDVKNYVYQFILNHTDVLKNLKNNYYTMKGKNTLIPTKDGREALASGPDRTGNPVMFILAQDKLWIKNGEGDDLHYIVFNYNKTKVPYYDLNTQFDEIDYSKLKERGNVGDIKDSKKKKEKDSEESKILSKTPEDLEEDLFNIPKEEEDDIDLSSVPEEDIDFIYPEDEESDPENLERDAQSITSYEEEYINYLNNSISEDALQELDAIFEDAPLDNIPKDTLEEIKETDDEELNVCKK